MRQRNIPVISKEQIQVQTDVRLLQNSYFDQEHPQQGWESRFVRSTLKEKDTLPSNSLLHPFGSQELLFDIQKNLKDFKEQPYDEKVFGKRLEIIEGQINGLLKREYLVNSTIEGAENWSSYYSTLNQKEKEVIRLMNEKIYADIKTTKLQQRVKALEQEAHQLRISLVHSTEALEQNKLYSSFFDKLKTIIQTSQRKGTDIEKLFEDQILPDYEEFNFNLSNLTRIINKQVKVNARPLVLSMAREMDKLLKQHYFNEDKQADTVVSLIDNFKALRGVDYLRDQFQMAQRTETAENNYKNILSLFKHEIQKIQADHPHLKGAEKLDWLTRKLQEEGIDLIDINGWMNLATTSIRVHQVQGQQKKLRELIGILAGQFKRVYLKFPELRTHCSSQIAQLFQSQLLTQLIEGASIERLKQIVVQDVSVVRVDDVYAYDNSKEMKMVMHLKAMLKKLLEELMGIRQKHGIQFTLDAALIAMLEEQCNDLEIDSIIELFRPPARYLEAPIVIENKVYDTMNYEKGVPLYAQKPAIFKQEQQTIYTATRQVPVYIQKPVEVEVNKQIPIQINSDKLVEVPTTKQVIVQRVIEVPKQIPVEVEKIVSLMEREQVLKEIQVDRIIRDVEVKQVQRIVQTKVQELVEVIKTVEKVVPQIQTREIIKPIEVRIPHIITKTQLVQIQKTVPVIIKNQYAVEVVTEVPIQIKKPEIQIVQLTEYRDKPIVVTNTLEKLVEVELKVEKELIKEVAKQVYIDRSHFIKGDKEEQIREVEVFIDKPLLQEVLVTKDVQTQKIVPLYIREEVPVKTQVKTPYISEKVRQIEIEKVQVVAARQQVVKPIEVEKAVPVIVEKQIVKVQPQFIDRIVEKIVEVPRIVQIQKIVEKIVPVPRIVEKIVEVPKIVEKIVVERVCELQIVEIPVPQIEIQTVEVPVEVEVVKTVVVKEKEYETVEVEKIVEIRVEVEKPVEVIVEKLVPYEVIREVPVEVYRDRIEYQKLQIHETKVQPIEVQIPFYVQEKVPFVVQRPVQTHDIIKEVEFQKIYTEKEKEVIVIEQKLVLQKYTERVPIIEKQVVTVEVDKIVRLRDEVAIEVEKDKIVEVQNKIVEIKEILVQIQKIVPLIYQKLITIPINQLITTPELIHIPKIVQLKHEKQIAVAVPVREERSDTRIVNNVVEVDRRVEVPTQVEISREKIKEIVNQVKCIINNQTVKEIKEEIVIQTPSKIQVVQVQGQTKIQELRTTDSKVELADKVQQKLIEKIVLLPQLVELVKNIHHISEVNQLGVAVDVDTNVHTENFIGVSSQLKKGLVQLLGLFKSNVGRQPDLKNLIGVIEKYLKVIENWIAFPKLIEIEKQVEKEVEKERVVVVPTENKEKQATLFFIMEKMITELRRIKESHKINLGLDEQILGLFFTEKLASEDLEKRVNEMKEGLMDKSRGYRSINLSQSLMVGNVLEEALRNEAMNASQISIIREQQQQIEGLRKMLDRVQTQDNNLKAVNRMVVSSNNKLLRTLEKHKQFIEPEDFQTSVKSHRTLYDDLIEQKRGTVISSIQRQTKFTQSAYILPGQQSEINMSIQQESYIGDLVSKVNKYEAENQSIIKKSRFMESEINSARDELNVKNNIIKRLESDFESKLSRARDELSKNPNVNKDMLEDHRKLQDRVRVLEKECATEKSNAERAKRELDRASEAQKRDITRELERKDKECKDTVERNRKQFERELKKVTAQFERIKKLKEKLEAEIAGLRQKQSEQIKVIREQQLSGATDKHNQLLNENISLRKKFDSLQVEYDKFKKTAIENNTANERQTHKLKSEIQRLTTEKREWTRKQKEASLDSPQETKFINIKIELEKKIKNMEADLNKYKNKDQTSVSEVRGLRDKVKNLEIQLEIARKELEASHKMRQTTFKSGYKSGVSESEYVEGSGSVARSPRGRYYQSTEEKSYISPQSVLSEQKIEQMGSSSSHYSHEEEQRSMQKSQMSLRQFMEAKHGDDKERDVHMTFVMIKIIEAIEKQAENGVYNSYNPSNIYLHNFDVKHLERLNVKFGANIINRNNRNDGLYLSPEVLGGSISTKKSVVFCLGVILDELIHGSLFFRQMEEIQAAQIEFKVRGEKLNPILKNTLFEMMNKEPSKRLELLEAKRRLSLQKYITAEGRGSVTVSQRMRKTEM